jgi:L-fuculose-phosphate aldolase
MRSFNPAERVARRRLLAAVRAIAAERLVVGTVGNASLRLVDHVLITPSRLPYATMKPADLVPVGLGGQPLSDRRTPSRELPLHLAIYRSRPDVGAVIHTHSPHAIAWSHLGLPLPVTEETDYYETGPIRTTPPAPAGSRALGETAVRHLGASRAVLLGSHGAVATGPNLESALEIARIVEHVAQVAWVLHGHRR